MFLALKKFLCWCLVQMKDRCSISWLALFDCEPEASFSSHQHIKFFMGIMDCNKTMVKARWLSSRWLASFFIANFVRLRCNLSSQEYGLFY